jgi:hypothetical protein
MSSTRLTLGVPDSVLIALTVLVVSALAMRLLIAGQWVRVLCRGGTCTSTTRIAGHVKAAGAAADGHLGAGEVVQDGGGVAASPWAGWSHASR